MLGFVEIFNVAENKVHKTKGVLTFIAMFVHFVWSLLLKVLTFILQCSSTLYLSVGERMMIIDCHESAQQLWHLKKMSNGAFFLSFMIELEV